MPKKTIMRGRAAGIALAIIVVLSLALRWHISRGCSLSLDEASTHQDALKSWAEILKGTQREHPPLMYMMIPLGTGLFGQSETGVRSVSLFFGCVLLIATYELCRELSLTVERALLVTGTLALTPFFIMHATEARQYAIVSALVVLALTRTLRILRGELRTWDVLGLVICLAAAAYTHYFALAYGLALLGVIVVGSRAAWKQSRPAQRLMLVCSLIALLVLLGFVGIRLAELIRFYSHGKYHGNTKPALNMGLLLDFPSEFGFLASRLCSLVIEPALAIIGLVLLTRRLRGVARLLPLGLGVVPCMMGLFISSGHFIAARYFAPSAVLYHLGACFALFAAADRLAVWSGLGARSTRMAPLLGWLAAAGFVGARLCEFPNGYVAGQEYFAGLQRYFMSNLAKDTRMVVYLGDFGQLLFGQEYPVGSRPISLERFRRVRGINRYLLVEINVGDGDRRPAFESLVKRRLGISAEELNAIPLEPLPRTLYQPPAIARLIQLAH